VKRLVHFTLCGTVIVLVSCAIFGCKKGGELSLSDTEGRRFKATCPAAKACELHQTAGPDGGPVSVVTRGRLIAVCPNGDAGVSVAAGECRPLVCNSDDGCPAAEGLEHGTCINGLCVEPSRELNTDDSVMLCLSGTGLGRGAPAQVERFALGLNCGTPCRVPRTCRQP
jgi:hypothetical protein